MVQAMRPGLLKPIRKPKSRAGEGQAAGTISGPKLGVAEGTPISSKG